MSKNIAMQYHRFYVISIIVFNVFMSMPYGYAATNLKRLYTTWHSALAMDGIAQHVNRRFLPYANPYAKKGGSFKTMGLGGFDSLDLFVLKGNKADSLELVYDTLMSQSYDEPYAVYPLIAEKVSIATDNSGVRFMINPKARFSDNSKVSADDVKFSFDMLMQYGDPTQSRYYADVKEAIVVSENIIEFTFKHNNNKELPFILTQLHIIPKHFYLQNNENLYGKKPLRVPLGSGPYTIESFEINKYITYKRNENYWAKDVMVNVGAYNFDRITIEYYKDANVALRAFLAGHYDYRFEPQAKAWANDYKGSAYDMGKFKKITLKHGLPAGMQGFYLNTRRAHLSDIRVREAILQAFDFEWSNEYLFYSQYKRTQSYYENSIYASSGLLTDPKNALELDILQSLGILKYNKNTKQFEITAGYKDSINPRLLHEMYKNPSTKPPYSKRSNLIYAQKLLQKAGYRVLNNELVDSNNNPVKFTLLLNSPLFERMVLPFKKNLAILGITLDIRLIDSAQYENRVKQFDYDIIVGMIPQSLFPGNEQDFFFSSMSADMEGSRNFSGVKNKAIDKLIVLLNQTTEYYKRVAILHAMDRILLWGFYVVPHYYSPSFRIALRHDIQMPHIFPPYASPFSIYHYWWIE
ncbi:Oligopeptide ABC transporter periplasmic oligopeptide-binding protein OppA [Helicobacter trogontum]|uniref:Oligopeptide ABC transporter periplasmic oligopeptide-binding protein OppA n=2 Tax=Helicobacter trogontum TaxID=50960 RepID=A0ABQ0D6N5_9HELI